MPLHIGQRMLSYILSLSVGVGVALVLGAIVEIADVINFPMPYGVYRTRFGLLSSGSQVTSVFTSSAPALFSVKTGLQ